MPATEGGQWEQSRTRQIGAEVKRLRGKRSAQHVANRTAELGYPIGRATISELEVGRRKSISVAELFVLAAALEVSPIVLLFPGLPDADVEVLPNDVHDAWQCAEWTAGNVRRVEVDGAVRFRPENLMSVMRSAIESRHQTRLLRAALASGSEYVDLTMDELQEMLDDQETRISKTDKWLRANGYEVTADDIRDAGPDGHILIDLARGEHGDD